MFRTRKAAIAALFTTLMSMSAPAQQITDANDILNKVRETYGSLKSFQFEGVTVLAMESTSMQSKIDLAFQAAFVAPAKMRVEATMPGTGSILLISDGHTGWLYVHSTNTYSRIDMAESPKASEADKNELGREALSVAAQSEPIHKTLTLCDLTRDPALYDRKIVTIRAILASGPEGGIAFDDHCTAYALPAFSKTKYKFGSPLDKRLVSIFKKNGEAKVTAVAIFIDGKARIFGNQNCCRYKLEIQRLLTVDTPTRKGHTGH